MSLLASPSVGTLVKRLLALYPELDTQDLIEVIRKSTHIREDQNDGFGARELIDETEAFERARLLFGNEATR